MASGNAVQAILLHQPSKEPVAKLPRSRFDAQVLVCSMRINVGAVAMQFQLVPLRQFHDELLVSIRFDPTQIVIEVDYGKHNAEFLPQFEEQSQKRD
jgi:hypothetical protein